MEIIYRAFDGEEFEDEDVCQEYEEKLAIKTLGRELTIVNDEFEPVTCGDDVYYFVVRSDAARRKIYDLIDSYHFERNKEILLNTPYMWYDDANKFLPIPRLIEEKQTEIAELARYIEKLR